MPRDSYIITENYIEQDLKDFISVEKYKLLEDKSMSICPQNYLHEGIINKDELDCCAECGNVTEVIRRIK